jgi:hypothetical protein
VKVLFGVVGVLAVASVLAWQFSMDAVPAAGKSIEPSSRTNAVAQGGGTALRGDDPMGQPERVNAHGDELPDWLVRLLYGPAQGASGYAEIVSAIRQGTEDRNDSLTALLLELNSDNRGDGDVKNVQLPLALLMDVATPPPGAIAARDAYLASEPTTQRHTELMSALREWPVSEATHARILELLSELDAATTHADRVAAIEELLRLGLIGAKTVAMELVRRCHEDGGGTVPFVHALLDASTDSSVLSMVMHETASAQVFAGEERASGVVNMIGIGFRTYLAGELGSTVDLRRRITIQSTLMSLAAEESVKHSLGLGVATAVALGGGNQDDPRVAAFLSNASKQWPRLAANTALVNLGYSTDPTSYLGYVPWPLTPPRDLQRMVRHADYIAGLSVALNRHPEQESVVLPYIVETLRTWRSSRYEVLVCEDVLRLIKNMNVRGAEPALRDLRDAKVKRLSKLAGEILLEWQ